MVQCVGGYLLHCVAGCALTQCSLKEHVVKLPNMGRSASHDTVTHLQHTAHCNTPHHTAHPVTYCTCNLHTATHHTTLQHTTPHCNTPALTYPAASPRVRPECTPGPDASALARKNGEVQIVGDCSRRVGFCALQICSRP